MNKSQLANTIDHTLLRANVTRGGLIELCRTAMRWGFHSVAINSAVVSLCRETLGDSPVVCDATVGFPLGQMSIESKVFEARDAIKNGAGEIDYVVDLVAVKSGDWAHVEDEMARINAACREHGAGCKVIFETCYLTDDEKERLCDIACRVRPTFIKTSTGFGTPVPGTPNGATLADIRLMKRCVGDEVLIKASGGIRTTEQALAMLEAGASRIGTSNGVAIVEGFVE